MSEQAAVEPNKKMLWAGRVVSALPVIGLALSATMKLTHNPELVKQFVDKLGYPDAAMGPIGVVELLCAVLYAVPQTSVLGAVLLTGYLGGAVATHVRIGEGAAGYGGAVMLGVFVWGGLFLRDPRIRALLPLRKL